MHDSAFVLSSYKKNTSSSRNNFNTTVYGRTYEEFDMRLESDRNLIVPNSTSANGLNNT